MTKNDIIETPQTITTDSAGVDDLVTARSDDGLEAESAPRKAQSYAFRRSLCWVFAVMFIALAGGAGAAGWLLLRQHQHEAAAAAALDAARSYATTLTTTDLATIDENFTAVLAGATGDFKDTYGKAAAQMRKMLIDNEVNTEGRVIDAAVKSVRADEVDFLLAVEQTVTNSESPDPRADYLTISMTMRKVDGRWLAADVTLAGPEMEQ